MNNPRPGRDWCPVCGQYSCVDAKCTKCGRQNGYEREDSGISAEQSDVHEQFANLVYSFEPTEDGIAESVAACAVDNFPRFAEAYAAKGSDESGKLNAEQFWYKWSKGKKLQIYVPDIEFWLKFAEAYNDFKKRALVYFWESANKALLKQVGELCEERDALQKLCCEIEDVKNGQIAGLQESNREMWAEKARAEAALAEARNAIFQYGDHAIIEGVKCCASFDGQPCDCGFDKWLALKGEPAPKEEK